MPAGTVTKDAYVQHVLSGWPRLSGALEVMQTMSKVTFSWMASLHAGSEIKYIPHIESSQAYKP